MVFFDNCHDNSIQWKSKITNHSTALEHTHVFALAVYEFAAFGSIHLSTCIYIVGHERMLF